MVSSKELAKLQRLAKLDFSDNELENISDKLSNVIKMINQLHHVDCQGAEPLRSVCDMEQRLREDEVKIPDISDSLFRNVPASGAKIAKEVKCFVVPKVIE